MKQTTTLILTTLFFLFVISCNQAPKAPEAAINSTDSKTTTGDENAEEGNTENQQNATINLDSSKVTWVGTKPIGQHTGTFNLSEGTIELAEDKISGGKFTIDINSLAVTDLKPEQGGDKLKEHLKGADFFDAEKNPTASFEITKVTAFKAPQGSEASNAVNNATHLVTGNFELKGVTNNITFPATIDIADGQITAAANFNINRTDWGLSYGNDESLGDKFIRPTVNVGFDLQANM